MYSLGFILGTACMWVSLPPSFQGLLQGLECRGGISAALAPAWSRSGTGSTVVLLLGQAEDIE